MELWIEGTIDETAKVANSGLAAAIATNPSIMARWTADGRSLVDVVTEITSRVDVPVYVQLHGPDVNQYVREMGRLLKISSQIHPKLVATLEGITAIPYMLEMERDPLITTVASLNQAFMAGTVGTSYIAPYVGRIEDAGRDAMQLMREASALYAKHQIGTKIAAASVRTPNQAKNSLRAGADILVMGYEVYQQLMMDDLTQDWIDGFEENWQSIEFDAHPTN